MPRLALHLFGRPGSVRRAAPTADRVLAAAAVETADLFAAKLDGRTLATALGIDPHTAERLLQTPRIWGRLSARLATAGDPAGEAGGDPVCAGGSGRISAKAIAVRAAADRDWRLALMPPPRLERMLRLTGIGWQAPDIRRIVTSAALRHLAAEAGDRALEFADRFGPATSPVRSASATDGGAHPGSLDRAAAILARAADLGRACAAAWVETLAPPLALRLRLIWPIPAEPAALRAGAVDDDGAIRAAAAQLFRDADRWLAALGDPA